MISTRMEIRVCFTLTSSLTTSVNAAQLDVKERSKEMEPMDCEMCETAEMTDNARFNDVNNEPFGHRVDAMHCSDIRCGPGTSGDIRTETVTPMEVDS